MVGCPRGRGMKEGWGRGGPRGRGREGGRGGRGEEGRGISVGHLNAHPLRHGLSKPHIDLEAVLRSPVTEFQKRTPGSSGEGRCGSSEASGCCLLGCWQDQLKVKPLDAMDWKFRAL